MVGLLSSRLGEGTSSLALQVGTVLEGHPGVLHLPTLPFSLAKNWRASGTLWWGQKASLCSVQDPRSPHCSGKQLCLGHGGQWGSTSQARGPVLTISVQSGVPSSCPCPAPRLPPAPPGPQAHSPGCGDSGISGTHTSVVSRPSFLRRLQCLRTSVPQENRRKYPLLIMG